MEIHLKDWKFFKKMGAREMQEFVCFEVLELAGMGNRNQTMAMSNSVYLIAFSYGKFCVFVGRVQE